MSELKRGNPQLTSARMVAQALQSTLEVRLTDRQLGAREAFLFAQASFLSSILLLEAKLPRPCSTSTAGRRAPPETLTRWLNHSQVAVSCGLVASDCGQGFESKGYDPTERAFMVIRNTGSSPQLQLKLQASENSPLFDPPSWLRTGIPTRQTDCDQEAAGSCANRPVCAQNWME